MEQYQFKTNINCSGCVAKVKPYLSENDQVKEWEVDTAHPDKLLTIRAENLPESEVAALIREAGFKAEPI